MEPLYQFNWRVAEDGYQWVEHDGQKLISDGHSFGVAKTRGYFPLRDGALFRTFADTPPTDEGILAFANHFGLLNLVGKAIQLDDGWGTAEPITEWQRAIAKMRGMVDLWGLLRARDGKALGQVIVWRDDHTVSYRWSSGEEEIIAGRPPESFSPHLLDRMQPGDIVTPALYLLRGELNRGMAAVQPDMFVTDEQRLRLFVRPGSLLSALWLQFARAVDGDRAYRRCRNCMTWFEVSPEVAVRTTREFCSDRCRIQAYRGRQVEARRLAAEGMSLRKIARQLDSKQAIVRGWVESGKTVPATVPASTRIRPKTSQRQPTAKRKTRR